MGNLCKLTGAPIEECPIKKMCLNCCSLIENEDGTFSCGNEEVKEIGKKKILEAVPEGFEIASIELKPMSLKKPSNKCGYYTPNIKMIKNTIDTIFGE